MDTSRLKYRWHPDFASAPTLVLAFGGWNDAGEAATGSVLWLRDELDAEPFVEIAGDAYYDFQQVRPIVTVEDGLVREVTWPRVTLSATSSGTGSPIVLGHGFEPQYLWPDFCADLVQVATDCGAGGIVFLGSLLADVPHTRPSPLVATASSDAVRIRTGIEGANYIGPTGIVGAAAKAFADAGFETVSIWASASHYVSAEANPNAMLSLLEKVREVCGVDVDTGALNATVQSWRAKVDEAMEDHPDVAAYVRMLERRVDSGGDGPAPLRAEDLPSGDELAAEFQRFLRDHGEEG
ncbi:MAG: PAC2 family protein [Acidimicrobiia bacterium]|nr:PAC2 family protein [Acidimicrobiia bacterium]